MSKKRKYNYAKPNYWNDYEKCKEVALLCNYKNEFRRKYQSAHKYAERNGWLEEICSHFIQKGNKIKRLVYIYEFSDKTCYIGLTCDKDERFNSHMKSGPIFNYMKKTNLEPNYILLTDYINVGDAQELEHTTKLKYIENGWNILNKGATGRGVGALGSNDKIWTYEKCKEEALKYTSRSEFKKNCYGYQASRKSNWLDDICSHMELLQKPNGYWLHDKNRCHEEALKYTSRYEFKCTSRGAYKASRKNGWLDELCSHMILRFKKSGYWNNYENCKEASLLCNSRSDFGHKYSSASAHSRKNGWLDEFFPKK